jgi:thiamine phosphate synthase YjbQ (UPF0047 family)
MRHHQYPFKVNTSRSLDVLDLTDQVQRVLADSPIFEGHVTVSTLEAGCTLIVNEKEAGLISDLREAVGRLGNGRGQGLPLGSTSVMLPAIDGALAIGTWQRVLLVELDSKASRTVVVQIVGD